MTERESVDNIGVDLILNAIYMVVIVCSFILITDIFGETTNNDFRSTYVNCLILLVPCIIDGIKELLNYVKKQRLFVNIIDLVFGIISFVIVASLIFAIIKNSHDKVFACIIVYGSIVCVISYAAHFVSALMDVCRKKFSKVEER